ncbi:MAG: lipoyl synthase [Bacteroidaceae bacterium]
MKNKTEHTRVRKPEWLKVNIGANERYTQTKQIVESHKLHTICSSGRCPNRSECWGKGTATFMIGGNICTRSCKFCDTQTGKPLALDSQEPLHVAESIQLMKLAHVVITSVDRDDLPDLGARHWVLTIQEIKRLNPNTTIEILIPDFQGKKELIDLVIAAAPDIISHNMETVERISPSIRSAANYTTSLRVINMISQSGITAKSGIMVGLGETQDEVATLMDDLLTVGCRILTIGQYLQPTHKHLPVVAYITPDEFANYKEIALNKGFEYVESAPLVRSSYHAENYISHKCQ